MNQAKKRVTALEVSDLYEQLKDDLLRFALSISRDHQEANDLLQDAWLKSLKEGWLSDAPAYKQRAWFYKVMKNQLRDVRRKEKRTTVWEEEKAGMAVYLTSDPIEMTDLLSRLPKEWGDLVFKRYWVGLSSREIGEQLGVPQATIRYKLHLALKRLRKMIEEEKR